MRTHEHAKALKKLVSDYYNLDVSSKCRKYPYIKARSICYKIMRDQCNMSYSHIARYFFKTHATILNALKSFPYLIKFDKLMAKEYEEVINMWSKESHEFLEEEPFVIKKELKKLREQNKMLNLSLIDVQRKLNKYESLVQTLNNKCQPSLQKTIK